MAQSILQPVYPAQAVAELLKLRISDDVLARFREPPEPADRRVVVWHPGLSLMEQAELDVVRERNLLWVGPDLRKRGLAMATPRTGYYAVCLAAPDTEDKTVAEQQAVVAPFGETTCPIGVATLTWLVHKLATGESLGLWCRMRCAERTAFNSRVMLDAFNGFVNVSDSWNGDRRVDVRLASLGTSGQANLAS